MATAAQPVESYESRRQREIPAELAAVNAELAEIDRVIREEHSKLTYRRNEILARRLLLLKELSAVSGGQ